MKRLIRTSQENSIQNIQNNCENILKSQLQVENSTVKVDISDNRLRPEINIKFYLNGRARPITKTYYPFNRSKQWGLSYHADASDSDIKLIYNLDYNCIVELGRMLTRTKSFTTKLDSNIKSMLLGLGFKYNASESSFRLYADPNTIDLFNKLQSSGCELVSNDSQYDTVYQTPENVKISIYVSNNPRSYHGDYISISEAS